MSKTQSGTERTVNAIMREDGTVYFEFQSVPKPISVRLLDWTLVVLWSMVAAVLVAAAFAI